MGQITFAYGRYLDIPRVHLTKRRRNLSRQCGVELGKRVEQYLYSLRLHDKLALHKQRRFYESVLSGNGARGGVVIKALRYVIKALRYKPAGRGFDSRWCQDFSL